MSRKNYPTEGLAFLVSRHFPYSRDFVISPVSRHFPVHGVEVISRFMEVIPLDGLVHVYLIFVTKFICETCGEKSVMWRNFRFLYMANGEESENYSGISDFST